MNEVDTEACRKAIAGIEAALGEIFPLHFRHRTDLSELQVIIPRLSCARADIARLAGIDLNPPEVVADA